MAVQPWQKPHKNPKHHLERALQESLERYELIFKATHDVLYDLDLKTGKVVWNEALRTQFGYPINANTGTLEWWAAHVHPDDALRVEHDISDWLNSQRATWQSEYRFRRANGSYSYVRDRGFVTRSRDGTPLRIIGSFLDITKQKELDRAKDDFISLVSHQLRTPLTVIRTYGEMFANGFFGPLAPLQKEHVARMTSASVRLIQLVDDILNISRIELGTFTVLPLHTDIRELIAGRITELGPLAASRGVVVEVAPITISDAVVDPTVFTQIFDNLLTNAIRYTEPPHGRITISFHYQTADDTYVLSVRDNGIGIPRHDQQRIFERFYRAHNAINIEKHGTGLGLYLVQLMTKALGGTILLKSKQGTGTTFTISFPRTAAAQGPSA